MSTTGVLYNYTIDDFDPLIAYSNYADWITPNPQDVPTNYNASSDVTGVPWHEATYHYTTVLGAQAFVNFTGSSVWIYGAAGPSTTNFTISLDPSSSQPFNESFTASNASSTPERVLLWSRTDLSYSPHELTLTNTGSGLSLDLVVVEFEAAAQGATLGNSTIDDNSGMVIFEGTWVNESGNFYNGTATYCQGPGNSLSFNFSGCAVYIYGDQVDDNGPYSVYINDTLSQTHNGRSGCDGEYHKYCEKLQGLKYFTSNLPEGTHHLRLVNGGPDSGNETFFNFDYAEYTTPSSYSTRSLDSGSCPFQNCSSSTSPSGGTTTSSSSSPSASSSSASGAGLRTGQTHPSAIWLFGIAWLSKMLL